VQLAAPAAEYEPVAQLAHAELPVPVAYVPAEQVVQVVPPVVALKVPVAHDVQLETFAAEYLPAAHAVHFVGSAKEPAAHGKQAEVLPGEYWPVLQESHCEAPVVSANLAESQVLHGSAEPAVALKVPAEQSLQPVELITFWNFPRGQLMQLDWAVNGW